MSLGFRNRLSLQNSLSPRGREMERGAADLGLPGLREQRRREKRDRIYRRIFRVAMWTLLISAVFIAGYNTRLNMTEARRRAEVTQNIPIPSFREQREHEQRARLEYRAAMLVPQGRRKCAMDWREGCLVCEHRSLGGTVRSTMC